MNRKARRKMEQQAKTGMKKKLTEDQYNDLKSDITMELANQIARERFGKMFSYVLDKMGEVLRENRISEERSRKILKELGEKIMEKEKNNGLS